MKLEPQILDMLIAPTGPALLAEYRGGKVSSMQFAQKTGGFRTLIRASHALEVGSQALELEQILPDTTNVATWAPPFPKGTFVVVHVSITRATAPGVWRIRVESLVPTK